MSSWKRCQWSHASPLGSAHGEPGVCSHAHQSLFQLPPSTWCAAVAVPHRKSSGNEIAMNLLPAPSQAPAPNYLGRPRKLRLLLRRSAKPPPSRAPVGKAAGAAHPKPPYTHERMSVLEEILAAKRAELALLQESEARGTLRRAALDAPPARDFAGALRRPDGRLAVVAEIKRRSPSKGDLAAGLDPAVVAKAYESGGAAALSVLTDLPFFGGSVDDLQRARAAVEIPALRKDFTIDETQVYESRVVGADAVLLIVAALTDDGLLTGLRELAEEVGIVALVEAHDDAELDRALAAGASIVGVNARDLGTFGEDLGLSERLAGRIPGEVTAVAESAIRAPPDAERARRAARGRARHAGAHLLQGRVDLARGIAQAEHRRRPGLLQQGGRRAAPHDRDRCGAVGERAGVCVRAVRDRQQGVHGPRVLRPEPLRQVLLGTLGHR